MVSTKKLILTCAVVGIFSLVSMKSFAQKIGVVDAAKVLNGYSEYQAANDKIKGVMKLWSDTMQTMQKALQDKADGYKKSFETMNKDAQAKAQAEVDKMQQDIYAYNNAKTNQQTGEILKVQSDAIAPVREKVLAAISTVAKKKKLDIIVDKANAPYCDGVQDISDDVSAALKK